MRTIRLSTTLKPESKNKFIAELVRVLKNPENHDFKVWISEIEERAAEYRTYIEVSGQFTKTGNPITITMSDEDFDFETEIEDEAGQDAKV